MQKNTRSGFFKVFASEILQGALVALLSVMTALAAYQGALADSAEADANVEGQKTLSLSNTEFLRATQDIIQDYTMYDGFHINQEDNPEAANYYQDNFSDELRASLNRPDGPFDDEYYNAIYAEADDSFDEAIAKFEEAQQAGDKANRYQLAVLVFAVGLALVAWASVVRSESRLRPVFSVVSLVMFVYGLVTFFNLYLAS